jgi:hypothetical protein
VATRVRGTQGQRLVKRSRRAFYLVVQAVVPAPIRRPLGAAIRRPVPPELVTEAIAREHRAVEEARQKGAEKVERRRNRVGQRERRGEKRRRSA